MRSDAPYKLIDRICHDFRSGMMRHVADVFEHYKLCGWQRRGKDTGVDLR
jgi:hypothetical protein